MRTAILIGALSLLLPALGMPEARAQERQPWSVAYDMAATGRTVVFENRGAKLSGTLFYPAGGRAHTTVIALHGARHAELIKRALKAREVGPPDLPPRDKARGH